MEEFLKHTVKIVDIQGKIGDIQDYEIDAITDEVIRPLLDDTENSIVVTVTGAVFS